jgi:predicted nucleotidyltransferase
MHKIGNKVKRILEAYVREVNKLYSIDKAILFGSSATGKAGKDSDIDIAIFSRDVNNTNRLEIMTELFMLIYKFKVDIQPLAFSYRDYLAKDNDFIVNEIIKKGVEIPINH